MGYDFQKLLENIKKLNDLVKKGNNSTVEVNDRKKKFKKLIRETRKELIKIEEEVSDLKKDVNEILKNPVDDVKTKEKLVKIIDHITKLVDISGHLDELWKLLEFNKFVAIKLEEIIVEKESEVDNKESEVDNKESEVDNKEVSKVNEGIVKKFANELIKIHNLIIKELKEVKELNEQLNKAVDLIVNESKEEPPMSENELTTSENEPTTSKNKFMSELKKLESFKKELEELEKLESFKKKLEELKENNEESNGKDSIRIKIKKLFSRLQEKFEEIIKAIEKKRPPKKYRKLSKWLRDYKDNQTIVIIFTILAGVDISHLELLGSQLQIPNINYFGLEIRNINFNAELSQAAENSLFWGDVTNIFIEDVSTIFIQCFYLSQVVSFGLVSFAAYLGSLSCPKIVSSVEVKSPSIKRRSVQLQTPFVSSSGQNFRVSSR
uniref:Uncharacterized protein n=1 Tax=Rhizophagus irregularis (strain DAOM 181602 / DAOM 197198 / MUCL 43194) TaxID=747089 RepID=U9TMU4_RHIID